ncbi:MAG: M48 family metallopeptidase [Crocinitomicaceae bacterium]
MKYIGLQSQINRNNRNSILLLIAFPMLILLGVYLFFFFGFQPNMDEVNNNFIRTIPFILIGVAVWFAIAFTMHSRLISLATKSRSLSRKENMTIYNLTENLCMSVGMKMPKLYVIESSALNAFASGINEKTYAVTLTRGIIETLDEKELEGVIAHELTHIRNQDVRLLIVSIIFVGIFGFLVEILFRSVIWGGGGRRRDDKTDPRIMIVALVIAVIVYFLSVLFKFALSRKREYLADAGAVEMTKDPMSMASALRKISRNYEVETKTDDVKSMFIQHGKSKKKNFFSSISGLFATHPPIERRIKILEQL